MNKDEFKKEAAEAASGIKEWVSKNPEWAIRIITAILFFVFGAWLF